MTPFLRRNNSAAVDSAQSLLTFLRPPLSRQVYDILVSSSFVAEFIELVATNPTLSLAEIREQLVANFEMIEHLKESHSKPGEKNDALKIIFDAHSNHLFG